MRRSIMYLYSRLVPPDAARNTVFAGGAQKRTCQLAQYFAGRGWETHFGSDDPCDARIVRQLNAAGVLAHRFPFRVRPGGVLPCIAGIRSCVTAQGIEILHCNDRWTLALGSLAAWRTGCRVVYTARNTFADKKVTRFFMGRHIVAVSEGVRENLCHDFGVDAKRVVVIYNGTDIEPSSEAERTAVCQRWGLGPEHRIVTVIGRLSAQKGLDYLLQAVAVSGSEFPSLKVLLVGDGELRESLVAKVHMLGLENTVIFCGNHDSVAPFIDSSEFTVLSSLWEGLPGGAIESLMLGKPVVATRVGGLPEVVEDGVNGFLVPPKDAGALASKMRALLENPPAARRMGERGRQIAMNKFTFEAMVSAYESYYQQLT